MLAQRAREVGLPDAGSTVTDAVVAEVTAWQARPLEVMYPIVFFDALRVKIRDEAVVRSKAVYLALAVLPDCSRDILGIWSEQTEGAKFWMKVFTDLKARGCQDILIAVTDGLKGMSEWMGRAGCRSPRRRSDSYVDARSLRELCGPPLALIPFWTSHPPFGRCPPNLINAGDVPVAVET